LKHLSQEKVYQIVQGIDIIEVISEFVQLNKAGKEFVGLCPFHKEKTPSFTVSPAKQLFYCFGCGAGGDILSFLMKYENCSFVEAVEFLAQRQGITIAEKKGEPFEDSKRREKELLIQINELAAQYYHELLMSSSAGRAARKYLDFRQIALQTRKEFCLGYSKDSGKDLLSFLQKRDISPTWAKEAGLISTPHQGGGEGEGYDRFRGRVTFPIYSHDGKIIALGGRKIDEKAFGPKYLNSSETGVYSKSSSLYGLFQAKQFIRATGLAIVVEGYLDFLSLYQGGFKNTVATLGTALTHGQVKLLKRYTNKVIFLYDADQAGISATLRGLDIFQQQDIDVQVAMLPSGHDPDSFVRQYGPQELSKRIAQSRPAIEFLIHQSIQRSGISTVEGKVKATKEILLILSKVSDPLVRMEYVKLAAKHLNINEEMFADELQRKIQEGRRGGWRQATRAGSSSPSLNEGIDCGRLLAAADATQVAERMLMGLICRGHVSMDEVLAESINESDFQSESMREIAQVVYSLWRDRKRLVSEELILALKDEKLKGVVSGFLFEEVNYEDTQRVFQDCVAKIKSRELTRKLQSLHHEIKSRSENDSEINRLLKEYSEIKKRIIIG